MRESPVPDLFREFPSAMRLHHTDLCPAGLSPDLFRPNSAPIIIELSREKSTSGAQLLWHIRHAGF